MGGGGKGAPTPPPVWRQQGYESEDAYRKAMSESRAKASEAEARMAALTEMQTESASRMEALATEQLAMVRDQRKRTQATFEEERGRREAETVALEESRKRRASLLATGGRASIKTGGRGALGPYQVERKSLLGA